MNKTEKRLVDYVIKNNQKLKKRLSELDRIIAEMNNFKENLTVNEICTQYPISRKTFDRYREAGMEVSQPKRNGKIIVNRKEFEKYLNR